MSNKKILYCASTASHLNNFHLPYMQELQRMGYHIIACVNESCELPYADEVKVIPFHKQITSTENIKNVFRVRKLLKQEKYTAISVHTTLAAAVVRAAVLLLPKAQRPKVFYTCHGYLFGDDDGLSKWKYLL
ncbi:MAG: glycosyltransferase family 1 protein, partial [Peptococcaceae bacterium]|nr:glycosyltransferase family 1 protein [Peptococcaceae bacterium]